MPCATLTRPSYFWTGGRYPIGHELAGYSRLRCTGRARSCSSFSQVFRFEWIEIFATVRLSARRTEVSGGPMEVSGGDGSRSVQAPDTTITRWYSARVCGTSAVRVQMWAARQQVLQA